MGWFIRVGLQCHVKLLNFLYVKVSLSMGEMYSSPLLLSFIGGLINSPPPCFIISGKITEIKKHKSTTLPICYQSQNGTHMKEKQVRSPLLFKTDFFRCLMQQ